MLPSVHTTCMYSWGEDTQPQSACEHKTCIQAIAVRKEGKTYMLVLFIMNSHSQSDAATNAAETELLGDGVLVASTATSSSESSESLSDNDTEASDPHEKSALQPAEQTTTGEDDKTTIRANPSAETAADILIAIKVLQVIETYGIHGDALWQGLAGYVPLLVEQVKASGPIRLMFSGFGFKSPSQEKVLGSLPDLGERLALAHLDGLCSNIAAVYKKGAEMHICSDGLVYNGASISDFLDHDCANFFQICSMFRTKVYGFTETSWNRWLSRATYTTSGSTTSVMC
jgi:hypothetical protein